jgi:hypothetical protein
MSDRIKVRKEAYEYILHRLSSIHAEVTSTEWMQSIPLDELRLLKEGVADPSAALVSSLKDLLKGAVNDFEIDSHLVEPFDSPVQS